MYKHTHKWPKKKLYLGCIRTDSVEAIFELEREMFIRMEKTI